MTTETASYPGPLPTYPSSPTELQSNKELYSTSTQRKNAPFLQTLKKVAWFSWAIFGAMVAAGVGLSVGVPFGVVTLAAILDLTASVKIATISAIGVGCFTTYFFGKATQNCWEEIAQKTILSGFLWKDA